MGCRLLITICKENQSGSSKGRGFKRVPTRADRQGHFGSRDLPSLRHSDWT